MTTTFSTTSGHRKKKLFTTILLTGLLAGTLDISAAMIKFYIDTGRGPAPIFRYIARGVFSKEEVDAGGSTMIVWGLVFHYLIAMLFTIFLFLVFPAIIKWIKSTVVLGILYGLFIWTIMNRVVVPLSGVPASKTFNVTQAAIQALILICMIGIPVSLIANWYYSRRSIA
jgi:hypothetical protein